MREIGEYYYLEWVDEQFEKEGPGWKPLSPKYRAEQVKYEDHPLKF